MTIDSGRYGPWAVIAGGSEGVGAAFAEELAASGINLVLVARTPQALARTARTAMRHGVEVRTAELDLLAGVGGHGAPRGVPAELRAVTDGLDIGLLVVNAGANSYGHEFVSGDLAAFQRVVHLNITARLALAHHYGAALKRRGRGGILLVGSLAGYLGQAHVTVYNAAKAFTRVFAEGLWLELREHGVHVLELVLGVTRTPAMERAGLDFGLPGLTVAEPGDVAREGLARLADGPVWIAGGNEAAAEARSGADRAKLVLGAQAAFRRLLPRDR
ncbi:SDR family NAD(P)-dependent oxidoreductase [Saccharomonospora sp. NPDC006951]